MSTKKTNKPATKIQDKTKPAAKAQGEKATRAIPEIEPIRTVYDPKNREVIIERRGEKYRVRKPRTAFESPWLSKATAEKVFNVKANCSQNQ